MILIDLVIIGGVALALIIPYCIYEAYQVFYVDLEVVDLGGAKATRAARDGIKHQEEMINV